MDESMTQEEEKEREEYPWGKMQNGWQNRWNDVLSLHEKLVPLHVSQSLLSLEEKTVWWHKICILSCSRSEVREQMLSSRHLNDYVCMKMVWTFPKTNAFSHSVQCSCSCRRVSERKHSLSKFREWCSWKNARELMRVFSSTSSAFIVLLFHSILLFSSLFSRSTSLGLSSACEVWKRSSRVAVCVGVCSKCSLFRRRGETFRINFFCLQILTEFCDVFRTLRVSGGCWLLATALYCSLVGEKKTKSEMLKNKRSTWEKWLC